MSKLTPKQQAFADYYIETGNATQAAIKAGYSKKTARVIGQENLLKPAIKKYVEERNKEIKSKRIADMKEIKEFWTSMVRNNKLESKDRLKASEYIAKTNGAFLEKVEHTGDMDLNIVIDYGEDND
ncbi:terminase small subunit [Priestia megaterium]|uniref:terminase small subunit n=1 Tax=Priestia megaterium TaxID=1404 RepID=UPI00339A1F80